jgi:putative nucleotidyltransferase with HDIG domain
MKNGERLKLSKIILTISIVFFVVYFIGNMLLIYAFGQSDSFAAYALTDIINMALESTPLLIAGIISFSLGAYFLGQIVKHDRHNIYSNLENLNVSDTFVEFDKLIMDYTLKLEEIAKFEASVKTSNRHFTALKKKVIMSQISQKNAQDTKCKMETKYEHTEMFYKNISEKLSSMTWITDYNGNVIFANSQLKNKLKLDMDGNVTVFDVLDINQHQFDLFRKKDFAKITMAVKTISPVPGRSVRVFDQQSIKYIIFMSDMSNQDRIMTQTYLKKSKDLHFINEISKIISGQVTIESTLQDAIDKITFLGNFNACVIRLINSEQKLVLKAKSGYSQTLFLTEQMETTNTHIGYAFNESKIVTINGDGDLLFDEPIVAEIINQGRKVTYIPLTNYNRNLGVMTIVSDNEIDSESVVLFESISITVTIALEKILLYEKLKSNYFKTVEAFVTASEIKSDSFSGHSRRVAEISKKIAEKLFLNTSEVDEIYITGLLHDVGKLITSETNVQRSQNDRHGMEGRKIIEKVGFNKDVLDGIEYHHLNYDLSNSHGTEIVEQPYYAQIIRLVSDFDMMMIQSKEMDNYESIIQDMLSAVGRQYSPQFIKILENMIKHDKNWLDGLFLVEVANE